MFRFKHIHHLIRYFLFFAVLVFIGYSRRLLYEAVLFLVGPSVYLAYSLKKVISNYVWSLPSSEAINRYAFLLPMTLVYFGLVGFQFKQLWNERGKTKALSIMAFAAFLCYIHFMCWRNLLQFFEV